MLQILSRFDFCTALV